MELWIVSGVQNIPICVLKCLKSDVQKLCHTGEAAASEHLQGLFISGVENVIRLAGQALCSRTKTDKAERRRLSSVRESVSIYGR